MPAKKSPATALKKGFAPLAPDAFECARGLHVRKRRFKGLQWPEVAYVLLSKQDFYGHHVVLFAGLKAWLLDSTSDVASRHAVAAALAGRIAKAENGSPRKLLAPLSAATRFLPKNRPLFFRIYEHVGGMAAIRNAIRAEHGAAKRRKSAQKPILHLVAMASLWDLHVKEGLNTKRYGKPSISKHGIIAHWIAHPKTQDKKSASGVFDFWRKHYRALPLLYAASLIDLGDGRTLLSSILDGSLKLRTAKHHMQAWFSYALHFTSEILPKVQLTDPSHRKSILSDFDGIAGLPTPRLELDIETYQKILGALADRKPSEKVVKHR